MSRPRLEDIEVPASASTNDVPYVDAAGYIKLAAAAAPSGSAGGDLTGTYPNPTIGSAGMEAIRDMLASVIVAGTNVTVTVSDAGNTITIVATARPAYPFSRSGVLTVAAGVSQLPIPRACTITAVRARVSTAPTGATLIVDVNKNGTTIFTTQSNRPQITAGTNEDASGVPDVTSLAAGDYLSVDVDQIGSSVAGSDLVVIVEVSE